MSLAPAAACYMQCCLWVSRKSKCSLAAVGVSVGQMINCALALKAVNSRAINSDESTKTCLWILWKQWKGKDVHLWFTPYSINSLPFICYFFFSSSSSLLCLHFNVCVCVQMTDLLLSFVIKTFWRRCRRSLLKVSHGLLISFTCAWR